MKTTPSEHWTQKDKGIIQIRFHLYEEQIVQFTELGRSTIVYQGPRKEKLGNY